MFEGHRLASCSYYHSHFEVEDLRKSRERLQELFNTEVVGLRMPEMRPVDEQDVANAGIFIIRLVILLFYQVDIIIYTFLAVILTRAGGWQIPASVSLMRIPLFWLSFHNFPLFFYKFLAKNALKKDGYLNIYFTSSRSFKC